MMMLLHAAAFAANVVLLAVTLSFFVGLAIAAVGWIREDS